jgi:hypothetical protein
VVDNQTLIRVIGPIKPQCSITICASLQGMEDLPFDATVPGFTVEAQMIAVLQQTTRLD